MFYNVYDKTPYKLPKESLSQRRIKDGSEVKTNKRYAVYLLRAESAPNKYHGWLCGGAIITEEFVVTSAACVQDVQHIYVIPGYKKYVPSNKMLEDECVKTMRKKVVLTCVPRDYKFDYNKTELWAQADIAVIKVESSFNFTDETYNTHCSYMPEAIDYNTEKDFPKPGDDVIALGWGHEKMFRKDSDLVDLNQATLHYAATRVMEVTECLEQYKENEQLVRFIATSMICTLDRGSLDDKGDLVVRSGPGAAGCIPESLRMRGVIGPMCKDEFRGDDMIYDADTYGTGAYEVGIDKEVRKIMKETRRDHFNDTRNIGTQNDTHVKASRRVLEDLVAAEKYDTPGICQNDHGGPLVAWRGGQEVLVAIATLYKLDSKQFCMGPYLFTKTWCNGQFINCVINPDKGGTLRRCNDPEDIGFEIVRRHISWAGHKDGPADNERIQIRHQVPMSVFQPKPQTPRPK